MKKLLAVLLAAVMLLGVGAVGAVAADDEPALRVIEIYDGAHITVKAGEAVVLRMRDGSPMLGVYNEQHLGNPEISYETNCCHEVYFLSDIAPFGHVWMSPTDEEMTGYPFPYSLDYLAVSREESTEIAPDVWYNYYELDTAVYIAPQNAVEFRFDFGITYGIFASGYDHDSGEYLYWDIQPYERIGGITITITVEAATDTYTLTYDANGGAFLDLQSIHVVTDIGENTTVKLDQLNVPIRAEVDVDLMDPSVKPKVFLFKGWSLYDNLPIEIDSVVMDSDKTVYAIWIEVPDKEEEEQKPVRQPEPVRMTTWETFVAWLAEQRAKAEAELEKWLRDPVIIDPWPDVEIIQIFINPRPDLKSWLSLPLELANAGVSTLLKPIEPQLQALRQGISEAYVQPTADPVTWLPWLASLAAVGALIVSSLPALALAFL